MKTIWICLMLFLMPILLKGQNTFMLYPIKVNKLWGCIDSTGQTIIQPCYDFISNPNQKGLIIAQKSSLLGIINSKEEVILPFEYVNLEWLNDSLIALTKERNKWAVFHLKKGLVTEFCYEKITTFGYNNKGTSLGFKLFLLHQKGKIGLLHPNGKVLFPPVFTDLKRLSKSLILTFSEGFNGLLNLQGKEILKPEYTQIYPYFPSYIGFEKSNSQKGLITEEGKIIVPAKFEHIEAQKIDKNIFFQVSSKNLQGIYDAKGREVLEPKYQQIEVLHQQYFLVKQQNFLGLYTLIGEELLPTQYTDIEDISRDYFQVKQKDWVGMYATDIRKMIIPMEYNSIQVFNSSQLQTDHFVVTRNGKTGIINRNGVQIIQPNDYDMISFDRTGVFLVKKNNKWGIVGSRGSIEPRFDLISQFKKNLAMTKNDGLVGLINIYGQIIAPTNYISIKMRGNSARLYRANQSVENLIFQENGVLLDKFEVGQLKTLTIKKVSQPIEEKIEDDWDFEFNRINTPILNPANTNQTNTPNSNPVNRLPIPDGNYEWFYQDFKWGLRNERDSLLIRPTFAYIHIVPNLDVSVTFLKTSKSEWVRRESLPQGLFNRKMGKIILPPIARGVSSLLEDFRKGAYASMLNRYINQEGKLLRYIPYWDFKTKTEKKGTIFFAENFRKGGLSKVNVGGALRNFADKIIENKNQVKGGVWGLVNRMGEVVLVPQYQDIEDFDENGFAKISQYKKCGIIDTFGRVIIQPEYDNIDYLDNSDDKFLLLTQHKPRFGYLDSTAQICTDLSFLRAFPFNENRARVQLFDKKYGFINEQGDLICPSIFKNAGDFSEGVAKVLTDKFWGFIDMEGRIVIEARYTLVGDFKNGRAWVKIPNKKGFSYLDKTGNFITAEQFKSVTDFQEGRAIVSVFDKEGYGVIDLQGNWIVEPNYYKISPFDENGFAEVRKSVQNPHIGLINRQGKEIVPIKYDKIEDFINGIAIVQKNGKQGFVDSTGKMQTKLYEKVSPYFEGIAAFQENGNWGYLDSLGNEMIAPTYTTASAFYKGFAQVSVAGKFFFINLKKEVFKTLPDSLQWHNVYLFNEVREVYEGYKAFQLNGLWGFADETNKIIIYPRYQSATPFYNGFAKVKGNHSYFYLNKVGKAFEKLPENHFWMNLDKPHFKTVRVGNLYGITSPYDFLISPPIFQSIGEMKENKMVAVAANQYGIADLKGNIILTCNFDVIRYVSPYLFRVEQNGKIGYWHLQKGWIWIPNR